MIDRIRSLEQQTLYDFRATANPADPLSYLFEEWVPYYRRKYAIARAISPRRILEIGVRYGYSALAFLNACPGAEYTGIDLDVNAYGGNAGALDWARKQTRQFQASFLQIDSQKLKELPEGFYDLVHVDGQQDGFGTQHDLELAVRCSSYVLLDGFLWTRTNGLYASDFLLRNKDLFEWCAVLNGYAGDLLIKTAASAARHTANDNSAALRHSYTTEYYLHDCGGYDSFKRTGGGLLEEPRLKAVVSFAAGAPRTSGNALDIGCGRGEASIALAREGLHVTALDYSEPALQLARKAASEAGVSERIEFLQADANELDSSRRYDSVIAADVVEHLNPDELDRLYAKVAKVLGTNGRFVIHTFPNKWFYQFEHARRMRVARSVGAFVTPEPRSSFELMMHINEQSPRILKRQLRKYFPHVQLWFASAEDPAGNLTRRFRVSEMRAAPDLYAVASFQEISRSELERNVSMQPLLDGVERSIRVTILNGLVKVRSLEEFSLSVRVEAPSGVFRSEPPCPVLLSYHWLHRDGSMALFDGVRSRMDPPSRPGGREYPVRVVAPPAPGTYTLRVTLLQETVRWFDPAGVFADVSVEVDPGSF